MAQLRKALGFVKRTLKLGELEKIAAWYPTLKPSDQETTLKFLQISYTWASGARLPQRRGDYFLMNAIGSTVPRDGKMNPNYGDVDFLLVTNRLWRDLVGPADELESKLSKVFDVTADQTVDEAYMNRPERTVMRLVPHSQPGSSLHLTLQPEQFSEQIWAEQDKEPRIVIYRVGDTMGSHEYDRHRMEEIEIFRRASKK